MGAVRIAARNGGVVEPVAVARATREEGRDGEGLRDGRCAPGERRERAVGAADGGVVLVGGPRREGDAEVVEGNACVGERVAKAGRALEQGSSEG